MSFGTFKTVIREINYNSQLTQVAFGLGSTASENANLRAMCDYLRDSQIVPKGNSKLSQVNIHFMIASCFSAYSNVDGVYFHCSFMEQAEKLKGFNLLTGNFKDYWDSKAGDIKEWRQVLSKSNRNCPEFDI